MNTTNQLFNLTQRLMRKGCLTLRLVQNDILAFFYGLNFSERTG